MTGTSAAVVTALRWVTVTIGCVLAADAAIDGEVRAVVAVGVGVLVAAWWTLRPRLVDPAQDVAAAVVLAGADVLGDRLGAFVPAVIVALLPVIGRRWLPLDADTDPPDPIDIEARLPRSPTPGPTDVSPAPVRRAPVESAEEIATEERRRAARLHDRVGEWLTYAQIALDRHLTRRPDYQLSRLRDELTESIREVEERSRQLRARITPTAPLASHAGRLLEWWSHHHGSDVILRITDPEASLDPAVEQQLLTVLHEAVDNVGRHAEADNLTVRWEVEGRRGVLQIADDGVGFDVSASDGHGLAAMRRAAGRAGADLEIESRVGGGTTVTATVAG